MIRSIIQRLCPGAIALIFLLPATEGFAQDAAPTTPATNQQTYRAGGLSFAIPPPTTDLVELGPDYRVLMETFVPASNRLVAGFTLPADAASLRKGVLVQMAQYAMVEVPRRAEFSDVSVANFQALVKGVSQQFATDISSTLKDQQDELNRRLKSLNAGQSEISLDKPISLGTLFTKEDAYGAGEVMLASSGSKSEKMVMGFDVLRVRNRAIFAYYYVEYKDENTVRSLHATMESWADAILLANK